MGTNLSLKFASWLEGQDYDGWFKQRLNFGLKDFAKISNINLVNVTLEPDGGKEPIKYDNLTPFEVWSNADGTVFKLIDRSQADRNDPDTAKIPYGGVTHQNGRVFTIPKSEFQKLMMFPKQTQPPGGGMPGGMPMGM